MIFFVNSLPPILSGVDTLEKGSYLFGLLYLLFGLTFIAAGIFIQKLTNKTTVLLQITGALLVLITAIDMYMQGKVWLPYAYLISFGVNTWGIWFGNKKLRALKQQTNTPQAIEAKPV